MSPTISGNVNDVNIVLSSARFDDPNDGISVIFAGHVQVGLEGWVQVQMVLQLVTVLGSLADV